MINLTFLVAAASRNEPLLNGTGSGVGINDIALAISLLRIL
jgi:hypothetical protein